MIEGIFMDVTSAELDEHLRARALHHKDRAGTYARQSAELEADQSEHDQNLSNNPVRSLKDSQRHHQTRAELFTFMADHLVPNEVYRVSESDLTRLELIGQHL